MKFLAARSTGSSILKAIGIATLLSTLAGCALGNVDLSGTEPAPIGTQTVHATISGHIHGGNNPVAYSTIGLYSFGLNGYGTAPTSILTPITSGNARYYPGGATGCNPTALAPTGYIVAGGLATYTATNTLMAGQLVTFNDMSALNGTTAQVTTAAAGSFTVSTNVADTPPAADSGTDTPVCYNAPTSDANGNFNITGDYSCATSGVTTQTVYITATGGNPGLGTVTAVNPNLVMASLLSSATAPTTALTCGNLANTTFVNLNEVTTAAMAIAMAQYFDPSLTTDNFAAGNSTQAKLGLANAATTALILANTTNGTANTSVAFTGGAYSITATPESAKLNAIADILAGCVNSGGGTYTQSNNCGQLFAALSPTTSLHPSDTLQAAALFALNPTAGSTANLQTLFGLVTSAGTPFPTSSLSQPSDFSLAIHYADTNAACTVGTNCALNDPQEIAFDAYDNIFVQNHNSTTSSSISELSGGSGSGGSGATTAFTPLVNFNSITGTTISNTGVVTANGTASFNTLSLRNLVVDLNGNVNFETSSTGNTFQYNPVTPSSSIAFTYGSQPYAIVVDTTGNLFYGYASTASKFNVGEFPGSVMSYANLIEYAEDCSGGLVYNTACASGTNVYLPTYGAVDTNGNFWFTGGTNAPTADAFFVNGLSSNCPTATGVPCYNGTIGANTYTVSQTYTLIPSSATASSTSTTGFTFSSAYGVAAGPGGRVWIANHATAVDTVAEMLSSTTGFTCGDATSLNQPYLDFLDGAGNVWVINGSTTSVTEFAAPGTNVTSCPAILSPVNASGNVAPFTAVGFSHSSITGAFGGAVDLSGNVWTANETLATGGLTQIVGIAAPVVTPIPSAVALFKTGTGAYPARP
jgi:hypothetical protein